MINVQIKRLNKIFNTPHPFVFNWADVLIPSLIVFFLLMVMAPFGLAKLAFQERIFIVLLFGLITAISILAHFQLFQSLPINRDNWTIGKELFYNLSDVSLIGFWNTLFVYMITEEELPFFYILLRVEIHTLLIGLLPVMALVLYKNNKELKKQVAQAYEANEHINHQSKTRNNPSNKIHLLAENGKIELSLLPNELLYIKTEGNYLEAYFLDTSGSVKKHVFRNRLKEISPALTHQFMHCHRSYIINIEKVVKAEGNAREMQLYLRGISHTIPVSRNKAATLLSTLEKINTAPVV